MSSPFPVLVASNRKEVELTCGRGCNCYHGTVSGKAVVRVCKTPEELIDHIAALDYDTFSEWNGSKGGHNRPEEFCHYITGINSDFTHTNLHDLEAEGITLEIDIAEEFPWLHEAVAKKVNELSAGLKAEQEAKKRKQEEEERQRQVLAQLEKERREKAEYERLKAKFETSKIETK
jgi:hypothetical protein